MQSVTDAGAWVVCGWWSSGPSRRQERPGLGVLPVPRLEGDDQQVQPVIIETGQLVLRPFTRDDVDWVHEVSLDPDVQNFVNLPWPYERENAEAFVESLAIGGWASGQRYEFVVVDAATTARVARVGLGIQADGAAEIGYWVHPAARGRGVATAAVDAVCRWAFGSLGLQLIEWRAEVGNVASRRVAEKAGFTIEATLRKRLVHRGLRVDAWVGSRTADSTSAGLESPR